MRVNAEQQRLISEDGLDDQARAKPQSTARRKHSIWSWVAFIFVALTVLALLAGLRDLSTFAVLKPEADINGHEEHEDQHGSHEAAEMHDEPSAKPKPNPTDYVLDPKWDSTAPSMRREYQFTVRETERNPDGVYRHMILVNEQFPGPLIEANEGDTVVVHVDNQAVNATSIHFHGMYQNGTNHMDGSVGVTQCPIAPGSNFTYEFKVDGQSGTYWWHSHVSAQASDGMYGPLVIHSKQEAEFREPQYSSDRVIMVSDHYYDPSPSLLIKYLASDRENIEPVPDTALINGKGIRNCDTLHYHRRCDNSTENVGWFNMVLEPDKMHRLRIINTGAFAEMQVSLDEHKFAVTEVDGVDLMPERFHRLTILPAQRYSIVIDPAAAGRSLWIRAKMIPTCFAEKNRDLQDEVKAVITFDASNDAAGQRVIPGTRDWEDQTDLVCKDMNTSMLKPLNAVAAPSKADATFYLRSNFEIGAYRLSRGFFNQSSFMPDLQQPTLFRALDGLTTANSSFLQDEPAIVNDRAFGKTDGMVIQTTGTQVLDLIISNFDDGNHPLHLHGYKYFVLAQGHGYPPENLTDSLDLSNPLRRDTATVEAFGWMLIRVVADNPGIWALHCHVTWHSEAGLMMQLLTRVHDLTGLDIPQANRDLCEAPLAELSKGATPADTVFYDDG